MQKFPIKGFGEGILITLGEGEWVDIQNDLLAQIDEKSAFFNSAKIGIEIGERSLRAAEISKLRDYLFDRQVKLFAVLSTARVSEDNAAALGLMTRKTIMQDKESRLGTSIMNGEPGLFIRKTLRSGTKIEYDGHVVVNGDVNPGAEINCTGSVFVWGKLRGTINAGVEKEEEEVICAMKFDPVKVRIATIILNDNKLIRKLKKKPVKLSIDNGKIVLDYWDM